MFIAPPDGLFGLLWALVIVFMLFYSLRKQNKQVKEEKQMAQIWDEYNHFMLQEQLFLKNKDYEIPSLSKKAVEYGVKNYIFNAELFVNLKKALEKYPQKEKFYINLSSKDVI